MRIDQVNVGMAVLAVVLVSGIPARAQGMPAVRHETGEITWVDINLGQLEMRNDAAPATREVSKYRITEHETRVTDKSDKKFLAIKDLQPGQHVIIDVVDGKEGMVVQKITADPKTTADLRETYGVVDALDIVAGTLVVAQRSIEGNAMEDKLSYFVIDPKSIIVTRSPSVVPVELFLKKGDVVKIVSADMNGKQSARSITVYSPSVTSVTTTTTVTTSK